MSEEVGEVGVESVAAHVCGGNGGWGLGMRGVGVGGGGGYESLR